jgi:catechol 2,3-dioxygenase-like lactoylglutathione lyase family enzyme
MANIKGIGGIFLFSNQAEELAKWYTENLGIEFEQHPDGGDNYFTVFFTRDPESGILRENPVFAINQAKAPIAGSAPTYLLNLRVDDLDALLAVLRDKGIEVEPDILRWERGAHAWIRDGDGNRVELYEEIIPAEDSDGRSDG